MALTRKQFLLGGLATATTAALLEACSTDDGDGRSTTLDELGDGDGDTDSSSEDTTESESTEDTTESESTEDTTESESTEDTTESESTEDTTESESTEDTTTESTEEDTTDETDTGDPICPSGASGTVLMNHGHTLVIPAADVLAGVQKVYDIKGGANHSHTVTLTAADFTQLALGNQVDKTSSFLQAHDHVVLIACLL